MENRCWYDINLKLESCIEILRWTPSCERDRLVYGMMRLIHSHWPGLLDTFVMEFPLDIDESNWYDHDPNHWLAINGLLYGGDRLQRVLTHYIETELPKSFGDGDLNSDAPLGYDGG